MVMLADKTPEKVTNNRTSRGEMQRKQESLMQSTSMAGKPVDLNLPPRTPTVVRQTGRELSQPNLSLQEYNMNQQVMSQEAMASMAVDIPIQSSSQFTRMPEVQQQEKVSSRHIPLSRGITLKPSRRQQQSVANTTG